MSPQRGLEAEQVCSRQIKVMMKIEIACHTARFVFYHGLLFQFLQIGLTGASHDAASDYENAWDYDYEYDYDDD